MRLPWRCLFAQLSSGKGSANSEFQGSLVSPCIGKQGCSVFRGANGLGHWAPQELRGLKQIKASLAYLTPGLGGWETLRVLLQVYVRKAGASRPCAYVSEIAILPDKGCPAYAVVPRVGTRGYAAPSTQATGLSRKIYHIKRAILQPTTGRVDFRVRGAIPFRQCLGQLILVAITQALGTPYAIACKFQGLG